MCDQTEVSYLPDDIVWVKLGPVWWPGRVCKEEEIPPEIMKDLRKAPIAIVKFFQEDSFEYVKKLSNIYQYNCLKKNEFIKKGLDMCRSKNRDAPSNMKLFPEDVVKAEYLTGGNTAILQDSMFQPEERPSYTELFASTKKTPKKIKPESKKKSLPIKPSTPRVITHPRFLRLSSGYSTDYEARERKQVPPRAECDVVDNSPPTTYRCPDCEFTTIRLNVMVLHNKSHTRNYSTPPASGKATKRKSIATVKYDDRVSAIGKWRTSYSEPVSAKIPKTNGTMKARSPKTPRRKKTTADKNGVKILATKTKESIDESAKTNTPVMKSKSSNTPKTDEFQNSLLEDWAEYEIEHDTAEKDESSSSLDLGSHETRRREKNEVTISKDITEKPKNKSCFDFDDNDDSIVVDQSKMKFGKRIPRVLNESRKDEVFKDSSGGQGEPMETEEDSRLDECTELGNVATDTTTAHRTEVDVVGTEQYLNEKQSQTSQLQEMGVDNEIEINTEEVTSDTSDGIEKSMSGNSDHVGEAESRETDREVVEISQKVDKLLAEIATPAKLPEIPRSVKKAHLKAYCDSLANQNNPDVSDNVVPTQEQVPNDADVENAMKTSETISVPVLEQSPCSVVVDEPAENVCAYGEINVERNEEFVENTSAPENVVEPAEIQSFDRTAPIVESTTITESTPIVVAEPVVEESYLPISETVETVEIADAPLEEETRIAEQVIGENGSTDADTIVFPFDEIAMPQVTATTPLKNVQRSPVKFTSMPLKIATTSKLKQINTSQLIKSGQKTVILRADDENYEAVLNAALNKSNAKSTASGIFVSSHQMQTSPVKLLATSATVVGGDQMKTLKTLKTTSGKSFVCSLAPQSQTAAKAVKQVYLVDGRTSAGPTLAKIPATSATKVRLSPGISPKTTLKQVSTAKSSDKNIVLSFVPSQPTKSSAAGVATQLNESTIAVVSAQSQPAEIMYVAGDDGEGYEVVNTTNGDQPVDFNYIVDTSGNLINVPDVTTSRETFAAGVGGATPKDKDILAKALENMDGLQTEMALSDVSQIALDSCSVAQNTAITYKTDTVYKNLTLNTPPIMSAYETPSRVLDSSVISEIPNEMIIISSGAESREYLT